MTAAPPSSGGEGGDTVPSAVSDALGGDLTRLGTEPGGEMDQDEGHVAVGDGSALDRATWLRGVRAGDPPRPGGPLVR